MVEPICALPSLSESLRDSQGASSVQHWTVCGGQAGSIGGVALIIHVLCNTREFDSELGLINS